MTDYFQDAKTGFHVLTVDNTTVVLSNVQLKLRKTQLSGTLIIGQSLSRPIDIQTL